MPVPSVSTNKEQMLSRIRAALGRDAVTTEPVELMPFGARTTRQSVEELLDQFRTELEMVGGHVATVASTDEVRCYLGKLISADTSIEVALSDGVILRELGVAEFLSTSGVQVVSPLPEFAATETQQTKSTATGEFSRHDESDLMERYKRALLKARIGITSADYAIAETGSLVLVSGGEHHRLASLLPFIHVCLLDINRIVPTLCDLLARVKAQHGPAQSTPLAITLITGPSRTADIEHTLTTGIHGPNELHVLIYGFVTEP